MLARIEVDSLKRRDLVMLKVRRLEPSELFGLIRFRWVASRRYRSSIGTFTPRSRATWTASS